MISRKKKVRLFQRKEALPKAKAQQVFKYPWRHSLQSGTSAFHSSCRTSTAKLRSRVCRGGESCMRSFDLLRLSVICISYALRRLARFRAGEGKSDPPSALSALLSYRSVHEGVRRKLWAPGKISLSEKYHRRNFGFYTVFLMIQKRSRFFFAFPIGQGNRACGARVLPSIAKMRQTLFASASSFFILLVSYPARSARRLPRREG